MKPCTWLSISSSSLMIVDWPWKHRLCLWEWSYKKLSGSETYGRWREQKTKGRRRGRAKQSHEGTILIKLKDLLEKGKWLAKWVGVRVGSPSNDSMTE